MITLRQRLHDKVRTLLSKYIPTRSVHAIQDSRQEPPSMAINMDAGGIMGVIASAEGGYTRDLFALYRDVIMVDSHIQAEWTKRKLAVLGDTMTILPYDKNRPDDVATADVVKAAIDGCTTFRTACSFLLDSTLYPVSVVEKTYRATGSGYSLSQLTPVPYHLLDYSTGRMRIYDVDQSNGIVLSTTHDPDPDRYLIHRGNLLTSPDNWGGPMRSILFWWLLSAMSREWWARFLERYGSPFLVGKYPDDEGKTVLERAFSLSTRLGGLVISRDTSVEIQKATASDSGDAYEKFLTICQREKSKLILGQTLSSEAQPNGIGGGAAELQSDVRDDIRRFDSMMLADTIIHQLVAQLCRINNQKGRIPRLIWGSQSQSDTKATSMLLASLAQAGLEPTDGGIASVSELVGIGLQRRGIGTAPMTFSVDGERGGVIPAIRRPIENLSRVVLSSRSAEEALSGLRKPLPDV